MGDLLQTPLDFVKALGFALPRFLGVFTILPLLSREALPTMLRAGVASCFAMFLVPGLLEEASRQRGVMETVVILAREVILGVLIGFVLAVPLWPGEAMGDFVDTQRGASMGQMLNPLTGHETSPLGQLFNQAVVTFVFVTGGFALVLGVIYDSYALWPVFARWPGMGHDAPAILLGQLDRLMHLTVLLASPVIFAMFLSESGLALVSRFVPQLQVFFLAMPIKSAVAFLVYAVKARVLFATAPSDDDATFASVAATVGGVFTPPGAR